VDEFSGFEPVKVILSRKIFFAGFTDVCNHFLDRFLRPSLFYLAAQKNFTTHHTRCNTDE